MKCKSWYQLFAELANNKLILKLNHLRKQQNKQTFHQFNNLGFLTRTFKIDFFHFLTTKLSERITEINLSTTHDNKTPESGTWGRINCSALLPSHPMYWAMHMSGWMMTSRWLLKSVTTMRPFGMKATPLGESKCFHIEPTATTSKQGVKKGAGSV